VVGGFLDTGHFVSRILGGDNQFVELQLERKRIAILRGLDEEDHKERDDCGSGVDYQLPGIAKGEKWTGDRPNSNNGNGEDERSRFAGDPGRADS